MMIKNKEACIFSYGLFSQIYVQTERKTNYLFNKTDSQELGSIPLCQNRYVMSSLVPSGRTR